MPLRRLYFALDLKSDPKLIAQYEDWHRPEKIWPEVTKFLRAAGIEELEIFRSGDRLVMVMQVTDEFSAARLAAGGSSDPRIRAWEELMWQFQRPLPFADPGEKWVSMSRIFSLQEALDAPGRDA